MRAIQVIPQGTQQILVTRGMAATLHVSHNIQQTQVTPIITTLETLVIQQTLLDRVLKRLCQLTQLTSMSHACLRGALAPFLLSLWEGCTIPWVLLSAPQGCLSSVTLLVVLISDRVPQKTVSTLQATPSDI